MCCFTSAAPIVANGARITKADISASIADRWHKYTIAPGKVYVTLNQPYQQDDVIERRIKALVNILTPPLTLNQAEADIWLNQRASTIEQLSDSIYAVRYHQRQFLFRLSRVYLEQSFSFDPPKGNVSVVINDRPLKAELETFLFRVTSSTDSLSKTICAIADIQLLKFGELTQKISKMTKPEGIYISLKKIILQAGKWLSPVKELRNAIAHDGDCKGFIGVTHRGLLIYDAQIGDISAGHFVVNTWQQLLGTLDQVIEVYNTV